MLFFSKKKMCMINTGRYTISLVKSEPYFLFRQLWAFGSLLSNIFIDDFTARQ